MIGHTCSVASKLHLIFYTDVIIPCVAKLFTHSEQSKLLVITVRAIAVEALGVM